MDAVVDVGHGQALVVGEFLSNISQGFLPQGVAHPFLGGHIGAVDFQHGQGAVGAEDHIILSRPFLPVCGGSQEGDCRGIRVFSGEVKGGNGYGAGFVIGEINQAAGVGDEQRAAECGYRNGIFVAVGALQLHGGRGSHVQEAVADGAFGAQGGSESVLGIHQIDVAHIRIVAVNAVDFAFMIAAGGQLHIGVGKDLVSLRLSGGNGYPMGTGLVGNLRVNGCGDVQKGLYRHRTGGGGGISRAVFRHRGGRNDGGTGLHAGDLAVGIHGGHRGIAGAPGHFCVVGGGQNLCIQLQRVLFVNGPMGGLQPYGQLGHAGVLVQAYHRPGAVSKGPQLGGNAPLRVYGVQLRRGALCVGGQKKVSGLAVIEHGGIAAAGHIGDIAQVQACGAQLRPRQGVAFAVVLGVNDKLPEFPAFCQHIVEGGGIGLLIQAAFDVGDGGHRIRRVVGAQGEVAERSLLRIEHFHLCAAVAQADETAEITALHGRRGRCVGPDPAFGNGAQAGGLKGVRIDSVQLLAVVGIDHAVQRSAAVIAVLGIRHRGPGGGRAGGKLRPVGVALCIVNKTAQGQGVQLLHRDRTADA